MIDLYGMGSPNVRKISIMLEELGAPYRFHRIDVFRSGQFDAEFTRLNPNRKVPVIVDRDVAGDAPITVFESGAILIYLAEKYGMLLPISQPARSTVLQWLMIQLCNVGPMLGQLNHFQFAAAGQSEYAFSRYRRESLRLYRLLDDRLTGELYLGGNDYSIADIATYPWSLYLEKHGFEIGAFSALSAWRDRVAARPAVLRGMNRIAEVETVDAQSLTTASKEDLDRFFGRTPE